MGGCGIRVVYTDGSVDGGDGGIRMVYGWYTDGIRWYTAGIRTVYGGIRVALSFADFCGQTGASYAGTCITITLGVT